MLTPFFCACQPNSGGWSRGEDPWRARKYRPLRRVISRDLLLCSFSRTEVSDNLFNRRLPEPRFIRFLLRRKCFRGFSLRTRSGLTRFVVLLCGGLHVVGNLRRLGNPVQTHGGGDPILLDDSSTIRGKLNSAWIHHAGWQLAAPFPIRFF